MKRIIKVLLFVLLGLYLINSVSASLITSTTAYWSFDNTLNDSTENGNTLANVGAIYNSSGKINGAYNWNGINSYMTAQDNNSLDIDNNLSISFWINPSILDSTNRLIIIKGRDSGDVVTNYAVRIGTNNGIEFYYNDGTIFNIWTQTTPIFVINNWYHVVVEYSSTNASSIKLFINNVSQIGSWTTGTGTTALITNNDLLQIGAINTLTAPSSYFGGTIDEVSIWKRLLNLTEISQLYNNGNGLQYPYGSIQTNLKDIYNTTNISIQLNTISNVNMSYSLDSGLITAICTNCNNSILNLNNLTDSLHNIIFISKNSNGQINTTANFTIKTTNPAINIFNTSEINSYLINWTQHFNYSDTNLGSCQVTVENSTQNCSSYNFAENGNQTIQIYVNDSAGNSATDSYIQLVNPNQYFRIYDNARALNVENYSFGNYNSSGQYVTIPLYDLGLGTHSLQFSKFGYSQEDFQFIFNSTSALNQTFNGTAVTITIKVYDESSPSTQLNFNLSMNNVLNYTHYLNQLNFQKYYNETLTGNLTLTAESSGFSLRKVFTELNPYSAVSHTIYLLADADSTPVVFRVLNLAQTQSIEDVVFTFYKEVAGIPTFLGQAKTDSQGYTYFNMDILTDYQITISKGGYVTQVINSIPGKADYTILMEEEGNTNSFLFDDFSYIISPSSPPNSIPFNASAVVFDEANLISSMKFTVTGDNTSETQTLTAASGGTIQFLITNSSSQYVLNLTVLREGEEYNFIKKLNYYEPVASNVTVQKVAQKLEGEENNENRVFMIIIIYVVAVVLGSLFSPTIGAVCELLPITIFAIPTVAWITPGIAALMYVFTILGVLYFER